ncbi:MAG: penicillin-binding protein [Micavibrio sp.]|nr:penicillin-binding protein [Micavibrio sp.]
MAKKTTPPKKAKTTRSKAKPQSPTRKKATVKKRASGKKKSILGRLFKWAFVTGLWAAIIMGGVLAYYASELPDIAESASFERQSSITILDVRGEVLARYGEIKGNSVDIADIPPHLIQAVMAIEDRRFYSHFGIDLLGLARAMIVNIQAGGVVQGGSTITQQLAKNLFLSHERTLKRKIQEAMLAIWLEHELSKDEIMSAYLNRVYLGSGSYGVDAAAMLYFDKPVKDITLRESAIIAGLLKAPSRYSPRRNPNLANERADVVLAAMVDAGYITDAQAKGLSNIPPLPPQKPGSANSVRYFTDWVVDGLDDLIGTPETDLVIETTLVSDIQDAAKNAIQNNLAQYGTDLEVGQGAAIVMAHDGAVIALVGGRDYNRSQFNRITQARRQPGSSFKPLVYLTALENGFTPASQIMDEKITTGRYRPENFGDKYYGMVNLETALTLSLNTVSYQLMKDLGPQSVIETARRLGIISPLEADLSLALGSSSISPLELATAYAAIANGGYGVFPYAITKIRDDDGRTYFKRPDQTLTRRVADERAIRQLQVMMQNVVENGTGQRARQAFPVGGKTGTSQDSRDAWFAGFSDKLVAVVWTGNDDNSPTKGVTGGSIPAGIWSEIMRDAQYKFQGRASFGLSQNYDLKGLIGRLLTPAQEQSEQSRHAPYHNNAGFGADDQRHESSQRYND